MCGIVGILNWKKEPDNNLTHRMLETIKHRGSDDYGVFSSRDKHLHMGHCRLSILDLSTAGHQPMVSRNRKTLLTYNGEIYNYLILKRKLISLGVSFKTNTFNQKKSKKYMFGMLAIFLLFYAIFPLTLLVQI